MAKKSVTIKAAWIGFAAIIMAAVITGIFHLVSNSNHAQDTNDSTLSPSIQEKSVSIVIQVIDKRGPVINALITLKVYMKGEVRFISTQNTDTQGHAIFDLPDSLKTSTINVETSALGYLTSIVTQSFTPQLKVILEKQQ